MNANIRCAIMAVGTTTAALVSAHALVSLAVIALTVSAMIILKAKEA